MIRTGIVPALLLVGLVRAVPAPAPALHTRATNDAMSAFGRSVAISGEFAFVGEPSIGGGGRGGGGGGGRGAGAAPAGLVHVYRRGPTGWKEMDKLASPSGGAGDGFGVALVADGATLLVGQVSAPPQAAAGRGRAGGGGGGRGRGAEPAAPPPYTDAGTVHVYRRGADGKYTAAGTLSAGQSAGSEFGAALAIAGDVAVVGAPGGANGGAAYVFRRTAGGPFSAVGAVPAQGVASGDRFGSAVAIDRDRLAVGAPEHEEKGAAYLFHRGTDGNWTQETPAPVASRRIPDGSRLGAALALKGDRLIAGAPSAAFAPNVQLAVDTTALLNSVAASSRDSLRAAITRLTGGRGGRGGAGGGGGGGRGAAAPVPGVAIVFDRIPNGVWREGAALSPFDLGTSSFGAAISFVGEELWIGSPGSDGIGRIYRARQDRDGEWSNMSKLNVDSLEANAQFAAAFAVSGDAAVVGMPGDGGGGGTVAFLGKSPTGVWTLRSTIFPSVDDQFAMVTGKEVRCTDGTAAGWECGNTGLLSFLPLSKLGARRGIRLSGMWGWTDPVTGHDIALVGRTDATAFVDVTDPLHPKYLGDLPRPAGASVSTWREIKTYKNYALVVSDGSGDRHGIQFFDLTRLRAVKAPQHFNEDAHYYLGSIHNIVVNEGSGFAYAVGTSSGGETCGGGSHMIDIRDTKHPKFVGCFQDMGTGRRGTGYTHDAQCVMYHGPDRRYTGHEICMAANETHISIQDVTDKNNPKVISHVTYPYVAYAHQGWFTEDQRYWYLNDELDEGAANSDSTYAGKAKDGTRSLIWDVNDLTDPILVKEYIGSTHSTDHNEFVKGNRLYQSNYSAGLRILDITDPVNPHEVGFMDTHPGPNVGMSGTWSNYPFFKNGTIGIVSGSEGLFIIKDRTTTTVP